METGEGCKRLAGIKIDVMSEIRTDLEGCG
jgi:hypothetical protein